eukprot:scaffold106854_cov72-Phaeocystis_antarctica.AAC.6
MSLGPRRGAKRREICHQRAPRQRVWRALDHLALSQAWRQLERAVCGAWETKESEVGDVGQSSAPKPLYSTHAARALPLVFSGREGMQLSCRPGAALLILGRWVAVRHGPLCARARLTLLRCGPGASPGSLACPTPSGSRAACPPRCDPAALALRKLRAYRAELRAVVRQHQPFAKLCEHVVRDVPWAAGELHGVLTDEAALGQLHEACEGAGVGQQQQALAIQVEAAHADQVLRVDLERVIPPERLEDGGSVLRVPVRGDQPWRLVVAPHSRLANQLFLVARIRHGLAAQHHLVVRLYTLPWCQAGLAVDTHAA